MNFWQKVVLDELIPRWLIMLLAVTLLLSGGVLLLLEFILLFVVFK
jgi:hypothetical protein